MIDTAALSRQLHQIHTEIYADMKAQREALESVGANWLTDERVALANLAAAVSLTAQLADVVTLMRTSQAHLADRILASLPTQSEGTDR